jgi:ribosomal protein S18 acetylase RimI-like enzyme
MGQQQISSKITHISYTAILGTKESESLSRMTYTIHDMNTMSDPLFNQVFAATTDLMKLRLGKDFKADPCQIFMAIDHQVVVGAASWELLTSKDVEEYGKYMDRPWEWTVSEVGGFTNIKTRYGFLSGIAVHPDHKNRGIETTLIKTCIDYFVKEEVQGVYATAWLGERTYAAPVLKKCGFKKVKDLPRDYESVDAELYYLSLQ